MIPWAITIPMFSSATSQPVVQLIYMISNITFQI